MQSHAPKQSETQKATAATAPATAVANASVQMRNAEEEEPLQIKTNPLQMPGYTDNPLQMRRPPNNPFQRREGGEPPYQGPGYKTNPLTPIKYDNPFQRKPNNQNPLAPKTSTYNPLQPKFYNSQLLQRMAAEEENESAVQMKKENNTGLPDALKDGVEALSGYAMDDVKVHYNSDKPAQLQALAYAQGTDIHVAPGQEKHLPHEAWHVVQQKQGRVQATVQMKQGVAINDDKGLEKEADVMGGKAIQYDYRSTGSKPVSSVNDDIHQTGEVDSVQTKQHHNKTHNPAQKPVQRKIEVKGENLNNIVKELVTETAYKICEASTYKILIKEGQISDAVIDEGDNKDQMEGADILVSLENEHIKNGLQVDRQSTAKPMSARANPYDIDIDEEGNLVNEEDNNNQLNSPPKDLSPATVLLHELGHAVQYLNAFKEMEGPNNTSSLQKFSLLRNTDFIREDIKTMNLSSPAWTLRVFELVEMGKNLTSIREKREEAGNLEPTPDFVQIQELRAKILSMVKLWMEHDVMIHTEHPYAAGKGEGLRLRHGEESDQNSIKFVWDQKIKRTRPKMEASNNRPNLSDLTQEGGQASMKKILQNDSTPLPDLIKDLLRLYDSIPETKKLDT